MTGPQVSYLADGRRLHLHHGPIDLIVDAEGTGREAALQAAVQRFETVLEELVPELPALRHPVQGHPGVQGAIAAQMLAAARPFAPKFVTPMAAVAGAVADTVLAAMVAAGDLDRAYVNNGGDIALHLGAGRSFDLRIAAGRRDCIRITFDSGVRGVATSGWKGRSQSLGIADAVTVLTRSAAQADVAATLIANAVDLPGSPKVERSPARDRHPDSDLGERLITTAVALLDPDEIAQALQNGRVFAQHCLQRGLIQSAHLTLQGRAETLTPDVLPKETAYA
jgi:ApbE superfamily uncharacterized protein (UPF0280 family)